MEGEMVRCIPAVLHYRSRPSIDCWTTAFYHHCQSLSNLVKLQTHKFARRIAARVGAITAAMVVPGLLLTLAGCGGDGGGSNVPEVAGPAPVVRQEPVARDDMASTDEDMSVTIHVLANDRDPDGDALSVVSLVQPAHGIATIDPDHTVAYTPEPRFHGIDTFAYTIADGREGTDTATVIVTVFPVVQRLAAPSRSTTIALTSDDRRVVAVNRETRSLAVIEVRDQLGRDTANLLAEIAVGNEPRSVALSPDDQEAYVTDALHGTVTVVALLGPLAFRVVAVIPVGTEPRGLAMTPNGTRLFVANHTEGTVSIIDPLARSIIGTVPVVGHPMAVAITNNGDADDQDERVFVTQFFAELVPGGPGEGFDTGKRGVVHTFPVANPNAVSRITLSPMANAGFTADRSAFCPQTSPTPALLHSAIFCPDLTAAAGSAAITHAPQGAFPNQLSSAVILGNRLFLPSIGAAPEPPVQFTANV
jgi:YVTN family beta-propeller protein